MLPGTLKEYLLADFIQENNRAGRIGLLSRLFTYITLKYKVTDPNIYDYLTTTGYRRAIFDSVINGSKIRTKYGENKVFYNNY